MEAGWAVKRGTATLGYKPTLVDESDIVRCIITTPGNVHGSAVADGGAGDEAAYAKPPPDEAGGND